MACMAVVVLTHPEVPCTREVFTILVEWYGHNSVCGIERFFHTITVMDVNINVQDTLVISDQKKKREKKPQKFSK